MINLEQKITAKEIKRKKSKLFARLALAAKQAKDIGGKPFIFHFLTTLRCNCYCESCFLKDNRIAKKFPQTGSMPGVGIDFGQRYIQQG